ncbi:MAG TPA: hypothetical protein VLB07_08650 [Woeseiaceae bacterium]|nr:hypothetical protein [Woeseiaceae bacterium]
MLILLGGMIAGALDIAFACTFWALKANVPVERILQSVAAGLLGRESFEGGSATASLGLLVHFLMTGAMAAAYYIAARNKPLLWQRPVLCGGLYGVLLYAIMNFVVVPLSAAAPSPKDALWISLSVVAHVVLVGIPIALASRYAMIRAR